MLPVVRALISTSCTSRAHPPTCHTPPASKAEILGRKLAEAMGMVGLLAVELFLLRTGNCW